MYIIYIVVGIISGILGGMGMGGGTLLIPLLTLVLGFKQKIAQGINLISFCIMAVIVLIFHAKNKLVNFKVAIKFVLYAVVMSILGALLANKINSGSLKVLFGWLLVAISVYETVEELKKYYN